jgi:hypothetical protein
VKLARRENSAPPNRLRCYVLIGYPRDTFAAATERFGSMLAIGFTPHAMLWEPETETAEKWRPGAEWRRLHRQWTRPAIIHASSHAA